jgi:AraC-like DNA-binding protein
MPERDALPVKEVATKLGYAHANDFTRAYSRYWMRTPTQKRKLHENQSENNESKDNPSSI